MKTEIHIASVNYYDLPTSLLEFEKLVQTWLVQVPTEHQEAATIEIDTGYDGDTASLDVSYSRPETAKEARERKELDRARKAAQIERLVSQARATLEKYDCPK